MQRNKIERTKILAALNTICPSCGLSISPAEIVRIDSTRMRCPKCGHVFEAGKPHAAETQVYGKRTRTAQIYTRVSDGRMMHTYSRAHPHAARATHTPPGINTHI